MKIFKVFLVSKEKKLIPRYFSLLTKNMSKYLQVRDTYCDTDSRICGLRPNGGKSHLFSNSRPLLKGSPITGTVANFLFLVEIFEEKLYVNNEHILRKKRLILARDLTVCTFIPGPSSKRLARERSQNPEHT